DDFFGARHRYHRDADGLYTPPAYLFDELDSGYDKFLTNGPVKALDDTEKGMDGTVKHFQAYQYQGQYSNERVCNTITDRYGNQTILTYSQVLVGGKVRNLLQSVTDPSGRALTFTWTDVSGSQGAYRITQIVGPLYSVTYEYYPSNAD